VTGGDGHRGVERRAGVRQWLISAAHESRHQHDEFGQSTARRGRIPVSVPAVSCAGIGDVCHFPELFKGCRSLDQDVMADVVAHSLDRAV